MRRQQLILLTAMQRTTQRTSLKLVPLNLKICAGLVKTQKADLVYKRRLQPWTVNQVLHLCTPHATSSSSGTCASRKSSSHESPKMPYTTFTKLLMTSQVSFGRSPPSQTLCASVACRKFWTRWTGYLCLTPLPNSSRMTLLFCLVTLRLPTDILGHNF